MVIPFFATGSFANAQRWNCMQSLLEEYVSTLPPSRPKPDALPLAHATTVGNFTAISSALALVPKRCALIQRDAVFLSYGRVDYRPGAQLVVRHLSSGPRRGQSAWWASTICLTRA